MELFWLFLLVIYRLAEMFTCIENTYILAFPIKDVTHPQSKKLTQILDLAEASSGQQFMCGV